MRGMPISAGNQSFHTMQHPGSAAYGRGMSAGMQRQNVIIRQAENLDENRVVLYKRSKQLGQGLYLVEISTN